MKILGLERLKEKLATLTSKEKKPVKRLPPAPRYRYYTPYWERNMLHPTAGMETRGRTLNPYAVATATKWRENRIKELISKITAGTATRRERWELAHLQS